MRIVPIRKSSSAIFVRRQSPDWEALAAEYRAGHVIDPNRYVPDRPIPGFPNRVDRLVGEWNARFAIDFFTFRSVIAQLSRHSVGRVASSRCFAFEQVDTVAEIARAEDVYIYFHDDDDFFSPHLRSIVRRARDQTDAVTTPLLRVGLELSTFVPNGCSPEFVLGRPQPTEFRFQTNNYGIHARWCRTTAELMSLKDHVLASTYAAEHNFCDQTFTIPVSATIKTPASASMLPMVFASADSAEDVCNTFVRTAREARFSPGFEWIGEPCERIANLVECVARGVGYEALHQDSTRNPGFAPRGNFFTRMLQRAGA
jgi:hypothetical protein